MLGAKRTGTDSNQPLHHMMRWGGDTLDQLWYLVMLVTA